METAYDCRMKKRMVLTEQLVRAQRCLREAESLFHDMRDDEHIADTVAAEIPSYGFEFLQNADKYTFRASFLIDLLLAGYKYGKDSKMSKREKDEVVGWMEKNRETCDQIRKMVHTPRVDC